MLIRVLALYLSVYLINIIHTTQFTDIFFYIEHKVFSDVKSAEAKRDGLREISPKTAKRDEEHCDVFILIKTTYLIREKLTVAHLFYYHYMNVYFCDSSRYMHYDHNLIPAGRFSESSCKQFRYERPLSLLRNRIETSSTTPR